MDRMDPTRLPVQIGYVNHREKEVLGGLGNSGCRNEFIPNTFSEEDEAES